MLHKRILKLTMLVIVAIFIACVTCRKKSIAKAMVSR